MIVNSFSDLLRFVNSDFECAYELITLYIIIKFKDDEGGFDMELVVDFFMELYSNLEVVGIRFAKGCDPAGDRESVRSLSRSHYKFLNLKTDLVYLNNLFEYNRFCILKANTHLYYYEFNLPKSKMRKKSTILLPKEDRELELLKQLINNGMNRAKAYAVLSFINKSDKPKRVNKFESQLIRDCNKYRFNISLLAELFKRSPSTISDHLSKGKNLPKNESG